MAELAHREAELERDSEVLQGAQACEGDEAERIALQEADIEARRRPVRVGFKAWSPQAMVHAGAIVDRTNEKLNTADLAMVVKSRQLLLAAASHWRRLVDGAAKREPWRPVQAGRPARSRRAV